MKLGLLTASILLVAGATSACGGPDGADAPTNASVEDFCSAVEGIGLDGDPSDSVDDLVEVGTPQGISARAREGFELLVENAEKDEVDTGTQEKVGVFITYYTEACTPTLE